MIDPNFAFAGLPALTSTLGFSTATSSPVAPIPTVVPDRPHFERVGDAGKIALWVVFVAMLLSTIVFTVLAMRVPVQKRLFHILTAFITAFATLSYFAMATGDGTTYIRIVVRESHKHVDDTFQHIFRQVFWARYIDWTVTTPLLLLDLAFIAGLSGADILVAVVADVVMILTGMFAAFGRLDNQRWGYYAMGWVAYLVVVYQLAVGGRRHVAAKGGATAKFYAAIGGFTLILWTLYPVVWALGDGTRKLSVDAEIIAYAVLDVLAKPVFGAWLLFTYARSATAVSIEGFWSHGLSTEGALRLEDDEGA